VNPKCTSDSLDICHSEKEDINNYTSTKQKDKKLYKNYTYVQEVTQVTNLRVILLEVEPISRLHQGISFKFNQTVSTLLQDLFHNERSEPHGFELACPQGIFVLIIDQDKITFEKIRG
jgi:hypothetical protein